MPLLARRHVAAALAGLLLAALIAVVVTRHGVPFAVDTTVHRWVLAHRGPTATDVATVVTDSGSGGWAYALAATAGGLAVGRRRWWWLLGAAVGVGALTAGQLLRMSLAVAVDRARPPMADWAWHASGPALPSGHTTTSALVAAGLVLALRHHATRRSTRVAALVVPVAWAFAVGVTRVYLGMHWPTDVVAGWLLATALACTLLPPLGAFLQRMGREGPASR